MKEHQSVMKNEVLVALNIKPEGIYVDATFGRGGHTLAILEKLTANGQVLVIDKDPQAIAVAKELQQADPRVQVFAGSFADIEVYCKQANVVGKVAGILLDLGVSSPQLDTPERGFSFSNDGPLDMRMDPTTGISAAEWLATAELTEIQKVLQVYGEEKFARRIAKAICDYRQEKSITTTKTLAEIVQAVYPRQKTWRKTAAGRVAVKKKHPATKTFQAIRIHINDELNDLNKLLIASISLLAVHGRLVVMSFHSLEDRIVKQFINTQAQGDFFPKGLPIQQKDLNLKLIKIGKKEKPSPLEVENNIRARSAILRVAERLPDAELNLRDSA